MPDAQRIHHILIMYIRITTSFTQFAGMKNTFTVQLVTHNIIQNSLSYRHQERQLLTQTVNTDGVFVYCGRLSSALGKPIKF